MVYGVWGMVYHGNGIMVRASIKNLKKTPTGYNNVLVRFRTTAGFFRAGAYVFFLFEQLGGFDPPIAQTKGPVKREKLVHYRLNPSICGTVREFSSIFTQ